MASRALTMEERLAFLPSGPTKRTCDWCRKTFVGRDRKQRFCKRKCQEAEYVGRQRERYAAMRARLWEAGKLDRKCAYCEQTYRPVSPVRTSGGKVAACCSKECSRLWDLQKRKAKCLAEGRAAQRTKMTLTCECCGAAFKPKLGGGVIPRFCSPQCRAKTLNRVRTEKKQAERAEVALTCEWCQEEFKAKQRGRMPRHCSLACNQRAITKARSDARRAKREALAATPWIEHRPRLERPVKPTGPRVVPIRERVCASCTHWAGGTKGCVLERFRACQPGVVAKFWEDKC